jgi:hypothetical protein
MPEETEDLEAYVRGVLANFNEEQTETQVDEDGVRIVTTLEVDPKVEKEVLDAVGGKFETLDDMTAAAREVLLRDSELRRRAAHAAHPGDDVQTRRDRQRYFNLTTAEAA